MSFNYLAVEVICQKPQQSTAKDITKNMLAVSNKIPYIFSYEIAPQVAEAATNATTMNDTLTLAASNKTLFESALLYFLCKFNLYESRQ